MTATTYLLKVLSQFSLPPPDEYFKNGNIICLAGLRIFLEFISVNLFLFMKVNFF